MKKIISIALALCLCAAFLPTTAKATSRTADEAINWVKSQVWHSVGYDDGSGYYQCVEFIQAYYEWLGVDSVNGNGADYATNALPSGWSRTAGGTPQKGDILVYSAYSSTVQQYGHVAIYESDNALYDQDGSVYLATVKKETANYRTYTYNYWGCIHPNFAGTASSPAAPTSQYPSNVKVTTSKSSYQPGETVVVSVTGSNFNWFSINVSRNGETVFENYDYNKSSISFTAGSAGTYQVTVSACKDWEHYTDAQCSFTVAAAAASVSFSPWESGNHTYVGDTDAAIGMNVSVSNGTPSYVGMVLYSATGTELAKGGESNTYIGPYYFKVNEELGYKLSPGTTYKYKFYAVVDGKTYWSSEGSFKTTGTAPVNYSVSLNQSALSLTVGNSATLSASVSPAGTPVSWSSSNPGVATVSNGKVTAVSAGSTTITATAGGKSATCTVTVSAANVAVTSVTLSKNSLTLKMGENDKLTATVYPSNATQKTITWVSDNPMVAAVQDGEVYSMGVGNTTITATAGGKSATCSVTVSAANVAVTSVTLTQSALTLKPGTDATLTATINPANATDKTITWSSSDPNIATVNNGKVVAVKEGTATITATAGGKTASCSVKVSPAAVSVESVALDQTSISLKSGESQTLTATVNPSNATDKNVTWSSSNPSVATVSDGKVTAVGAGSTTIIASAGGKTVSCSVTVAQKSSLQIGTASIPAATAGTAYNQTLIANSTDPVTWSVTSGALPSGLTLSGNGVISGTPTDEGTYSFTVSATGKAGTDSKSYSITVSSSAASARAEVHFERKNVYYQDQFSDVKANQWYTDTVASAFELGLMKGDSATTFNPYGDVTIAEAITMAARVHSINATGTENFLQTGTWYQVYLNYAYQNGIISYAYYNSDVTQKATRAQFAEIFAASLSSEYLYAINQIADNAVPDVSMSASYAESVYRLYRAGILTGSDALGHFNPQTYITRAEAATILSRMAESNNRVGFSLGG